MRSGTFQLAGTTARAENPRLGANGNMPFESDKVMFEIYREADNDRRYRVVYYTELTDHNKEQEINSALAGENFYDGFLAGSTIDAARGRIYEVIRRLNDDEPLDVQQVEEHLSGFLA